jgi:hypothetical protein
MQHTESIVIVVDFTVVSIRLFSLGQVMSKFYGYLNCVLQVFGNPIVETFPKVILIC